MNVKTRRTAYSRKIKPILVPTEAGPDATDPDKMEQVAPNKIQHGAPENPKKPGPDKMFGMDHNAHALDKMEPGAHASDLIKEDCTSNLPEICRKVSQGF